MSKVKVLVFLGHYLPGYKAGGALRTIANIVAYLSDSIEFWIVTSDRDIGDIVPYKDVIQNKWQRFGEANVFYAEKKYLTISNVLNIINTVPCDVIYFNSFFNYYFTIKPLLIIRFKKSLMKKIILAPRGEFSQGALSIKRIKKFLFMKLVGYMGLYKNIRWHASSSYEAEDIKKAIKNIALKEVVIARDLPSKLSVLPCKVYDNKQEEVKQTKLVFLSRISPMKNLEYALNILRSNNENIIFDVYGPVEDSAYFKKCKQVADSLPKNIRVNFKGAVDFSEVHQVLIEYDLFFLPTLGENYSHVIAESLTVGTPVLISDQTFWRNLEKDHLGWDFALKDEIKFAESISSICKLTREEKDKWRSYIRSFVINHVIDWDQVINDNKKLFILSDDEPI